MNKLLLLVVVFLTALTGLSAADPLEGKPYLRSASFNDSNISRVTTNPKDGFRDLFIEEASTTVHKLNPKAVSFVQDYMEDESVRLMKMKDWGRPFFDKINTIFLSYNLPVELKYLAVIESDLLSSATSRVGAAGPWQFMPVTGRELGLRINRSVDERRDFIKSTNAAARYLTSLFNLYGDWLLVIAAYNGGPGNVNAAIRKSGSRNFWDLQYHLPAESRNHVKKFIATHFIMEGNGGLTTLTKMETELLPPTLTSAPVLDSTIARFQITGKYHPVAITQSIGMDMVEFRKLNPNFEKMLSANGTYELHLPNEKMSLFQAGKPQILEQSVRLIINSVNVVQQR